MVEKVGDGFDEAAVAAAMQYVFEPAEIDGKPGAIAVETTINFMIEQQPVESSRRRRRRRRTHDGPPNHAGSMKAPVTLQGEVVERGTRKKLAGVIVSIAELGLDVVTANDGTFFFHGVPPGKYTVLAVDEHYDRFKRPIEISKKEALEVRLWMRPRGGNPYETVIEGERENMEVTKRSLQRQQLTNIPGTFGDPIRVIQTLPGIQRAPFGLGLLLVRGSNPDDTGIFVDGHEVPGLFHFLGGPSIFNAEMLESIDLYPGGFPGRFGRHHGGVVALESRDRRSPMASTARRRSTSSTPAATSARRSPTTSRSRSRAGARTSTCSSASCCRRRRRARRASSRRSTTTTRRASTTTCTRKVTRACS